jgi:hypothetical protein
MKREKERKAAVYGEVEHRHMGKVAAVQGEVGHHRKADTGGGAGRDGTPSREEMIRRATGFHCEPAVVCPRKL